MSYTVILTPEAAANLRHFDKSTAVRIVSKLVWFALNFEEVTPEPLTGQFKGTFRFRIGDYRAVYSLDHKDKVINVLTVHHRSGVYKPK